MTDEKKLFDDVMLNDGEQATIDTIEELSNGKGDDENE